MKQQLNQLAAYQPGLSPRALKEKHGIEGELYKLASNENLYGCLLYTSDAADE